MNLGPTKKKETVRVSEKDLRRLLNDNEQLSRQVNDLQERCNEYLEEVRDLKQKIFELEAQRALEAQATPPPLDFIPHIALPRSDIYFD